MGQITSNAIAYAAFKTAGGWKKCLYINIAYAAIVLGIIILMVSAQRDRAQELISGVPTVMLSLQFFALGGFASLAILAMLQRDNTTKMMESHRLMPIDPRLAVFGYMVGPALMVMPAVLFNFIVGGVCAGMSDLPLSWWLTANLTTLTFCMFGWSLAAAGGFFGNFVGMAVLAPLGIATISGGAATIIMLPMALLASPTLGRSIYDARGYSGDGVMLLAIAFALQAAVGMIAIQAASRRFRSPEIPVFTPLLSVLLVALLSAAGVIIACVPDQLPHFAFRNGIEAPSCVGTTIFLMIIGAVPLLSLGASERLASAAGRRWSADLLTLGLMSACVAAFSACIVALPTNLVGRSLWTFFEMIFAWGWILFWARLMFRWGLGFAGVLLVGIALHLGPALVSILFTQHHGGLSPLGQFIVQISPMGFIPAIWGEGAGEINVAAAAVQAMLLLVPIGLLLRARSRTLNPMLRAVHI